jgi:protein gp37
MGEKTEISWAHSTFNPWVGCTKVGPGCEHCYAEREMATRMHVVEWGVGAPRKRTSYSNWQKPLKWNREAAETGRPWYVFCASLADVFDHEVPDDWRRDLWALIERTPHLTWMLLTKRIGNARALLPPQWVMHGCALPANVWLGATVVNQDEADRDIPKLLQFSASVRWLSIEPQLGPVDLACFIPSTPDVPWHGIEGWNRGPFVNWVITGGESGPKSIARPYVLGWAEDLVRQCRAAGVAVHVKQLGSNPTNREGAPHPQHHPKGGEPAEWPVELRVREFPRQPTN